MTVRLDEQTARQLSDLATGYPSKSAAVLDAIRTAWQQLQDEQLDAAYAAAATENAAYPYESAEERAVAAARRNRRDSIE